MTFGTTIFLSLGLLIYRIRNNSVDKNNNMPDAGIYKLQVLCKIYYYKEYLEHYKKKETILHLSK